VGDWVLVEPGTHLLRRRLERATVLARRTEGSKTPQLAGANIDTLFIVTSCNADFNVARLERYLALANESGADPVILLTKADLVPDVQPISTRPPPCSAGCRCNRQSAQHLGRGGCIRALVWRGSHPGAVGSSGVGKSTLVNALAGSIEGEPQQTGDIRAHDAKGRHTTTSRSLHAIAGGGWVIDTPGMRTLHVSDAASGLETLFAEITELSPLCRFRDCTHEHEPGCAVQEASRRPARSIRALPAGENCSRQFGDQFLVPAGVKRPHAFLDQRVGRMQRQVRRRGPDHGPGAVVRRHGQLPGIGHAAILRASVRPPHQLRSSMATPATPVCR
jgi:ribosome biogenesis GTPase